VPAESVVQEINLDEKPAPKTRRTSGRKSLDKTATAAAVTAAAVFNQPPPAPAAVVKPEPVAVKAEPPAAPAAKEAAPSPVTVLAARAPRDKTADPALCLDTVGDMYVRWKVLEVPYSPAHYMSEQKDITYRMRGILVDWLVEVHYKFKLHGPSLWLTINLLDRYLQKNQITRDRLQLVGVASLLIASKFDEVSPPEVDDCVHITDNSYSKRDVLQMEYKIFETLGFQVAVPTGFSFISRFLGLINADDTMKFTALFYAERSLQEQHFLSVLPSHFTAAAVMAALWKRRADSHNPVTDPPITASEVWPAVLEQESGYSGDTLMPCARNLILHAGQEPVTTSQRRLIAAKKKYSQEKYFNIAALPLPVLA
jgi:hypothetical protein